MDNNLFSKTIDSIKNKYKECYLEIKLSADFKNKHESYTIYKNNCLLSYSVNGYKSQETIILYGDHLNKKHGIIVNENGKKYYITNTMITEIKITYENVDYIKKGTILEINENIEEVEAIKIGKKYYMYKG